MNGTIIFEGHTGTAPTDYTTGGYACGSCGTWITYGMMHACYQPNNYLFVPTTFTTIDSQRLAELMEAERKLAEIQRILKE